MLHYQDINAVIDEIEENFFDDIHDAEIDETFEILRKNNSNNHWIEFEDGHMVSISELKKNITPFKREYLKTQKPHIFKRLFGK